MKKMLFLLIFLVGCAGIQIPPEPKYEKMSVYTFEGGIICFDKENADLLRENIKLLREYQADLLRLLRKEER